VAANPWEEQQMRIYLTSVLVDDQDQALRFCTDVLGFVKKSDIPLGEARWLTVASAARPYKAALVADGIPAPPSPSTTCMLSSGGSATLASGSPRSRSRWAL
jgi:hypothetical protein